MTETENRLAQRMDALEQRMNHGERRLDVLEAAGKHAQERFDDLRSFFAGQVTQLKEAIANDRKETKAELDQWRDNTRWLLRAILGAIITSMVLGLGALLWLGLSAKVNAHEQQGTAALYSPLGATNDHTSSTLGADPRS